MQEWIRQWIGPLRLEKGIDCIKCTGAQRHLEGRSLISPELKCCAFFPFIPNVFVHDLLSSLDHKTGGEISPLGLYPDHWYQKKFHESRNQGVFVNQKLRCPFLTPDARCQIWHTRPSPCYSFHCASDHGPEGLKEWSRIEALGRFLEVNLAVECALDLGLDGNEIDICLRRLPQDQNPVPQEPSTLLFEQFGLGDPYSYFARAQNWYLQLTEQEVRRRLGPDLDVLISSVVRAKAPSDELKPSW